MLARTLPICGFQIERSKIIKTLVFEPLMHTRVSRDTIKIGSSKFDDLRRYLNTQSSEIPEFFFLSLDSRLELRLGTYVTLVRSWTQTRPYTSLVFLSHAQKVSLCSNI